MLSPLDRDLSSRRRTTLVREVRHNLRATGAKDARPIIIGCSGGPDSTALVIALCALRESLNLDLHVVAVDHKLRESAAEEARDVCALAEKLHLSSEVIAVDVPHGPSRMALSRTARYAAIANVAQARGARFVAVGHTRDDQAETMLMRLFGGAGLTGLSGMAVVAPFPTPLVGDSRAVQLLRPLLSVSRRAVESFLQPLLPSLSPLPFTDPTNADPRYLRTRLRDEALPLLRRIAPHLDEHLLHLSTQLRADAEHLDDAAAQALCALQPTVTDGILTLSVKRFSTLSRAVKARVLRLVTQRHLDIALGQRHVEALLDLCATIAGNQSLDLPGGLCAQRRRACLHLFRRDGRCFS